MTAILTALALLVPTAAPSMAVEFNNSTVNAFGR